MTTPHLDELLRRVCTAWPDAERTRGGLRFTVPELADPVDLRVVESDLAQAVDTIGRGCRDDLWPGATYAEAGFNLLLVHLDEVLATRVIDRFLLIDRTGLVWPEQQRPFD